MVHIIIRIADRIRFLRDKAGMTQSELARKLGISRNAVNSWEMGLSSPSISNLIEMMQLFHVTADYLISTDDRFTVDISHLNDEEQAVIVRMIRCLEAKETE